LLASTWQATTRVELVSLVEPERVVSYVEALGGVVELRSGDRVQAIVPDATMDELYAARGLMQVDEPAIFVPLQLADPSATLGIPPWHAAGFSGEGVRVAVVDSGFRGYAERSGTSLPADVSAVSFRADGDLEAGTDHGTLAAEIIHSIAPAAQMYLVNFATVTELSAAVDYLVSEGIDVISFSLGFIHNGPGNGTGPVASIVTKGAERDALWTVSAGNWARQHWRGAFLDGNRDSLHEFGPGQLLNGRNYEAGDLIIVSLRWDDEWGASCSDYDLELFGPNGALVRASRRVQSCSGNPVESLQVLATEAGRYSVRIIEARSEVPKMLDLLMVGSPDRGAVLDTFSPESSLAEPADHPSVVTVGALASDESSRVAGFSSRGPTTDGRPKPEVLSPTGQAAPGIAAFAGTSAAAPHVAGLVALLREAAPDASAAAIRDLVTSRAFSINASAPTGAPERLANLGAPSDFGPLLPPGAAEARLTSTTPPAGAGLALAVYRGPDGYPLRFAHLLTDPRRASAYFRFDEASQSFRHYIVGAPSRVQSFTMLTDDTPYVIRYRAP